MWLLDSNRDKHFIYAMPVGLIGTILCVIGMAIGMEYKDYTYGNKFDWLDVAATVLGGLVGQIIQILLIVILL